MKCIADAFVRLVTGITFGVLCTLAILVGGHYIHDPYGVMKGPDELPYRVQEDGTVEAAETPPAASEVYASVVRRYESWDGEIYPAGYSYYVIRRVDGKLGVIRRWPDDGYTLLVSGNEYDFTGGRYYSW